MNDSAGKPASGLGGPSDTAIKLGTAPVFMTAISTILGAIMFLRFGYAVGNVAFVGALGIILLGHLVTIPTAMALAEIATNQKVAGGGEYFIISRSFGILIGAAIGIALFLSQAISVAFYMIAFAEAFRPLLDWLEQAFDLTLSDPRIVSVPGLVLLAVLILTRGADLGIKVLYGVVATLMLSLLFFFIGPSSLEAGEGLPERLVAHVASGDGFFLVFAICFPAFTGMTAGVGLSGDLRDPSRSIPLGTLTATLVGMVVYVGIAFKLAISAAPEDLANDQLIMSKIAIWGPIIPIGLACATVSSALGSALVAPRTLQALAHDRVLPFPRVGRWLSEGRGAANEPVHASLVVFIIALAFVLMGNVDFVAQIISMFFMVTYGSLCLISFLEHFGGDPSYRPTFRSRWYVSLIGALTCLWLMFKMSAPYAVLAIVLMFGLYGVLSATSPEHHGLARLFRGVIFQLSRRLQVFLQKSSRRTDDETWRPAVVCISSACFDRRDAFDLLRWLSRRHGFGTFIHYLPGYLSRQTAEEARETLDRLVHLAEISESQVYVDTMVSPSYTTAVAQVAQLPGISGKENNTILFEYQRSNGEGLQEIIDNYQLLAASGFDICILGTNERGFGYRREIHVWLTQHDLANASLMILLAYIVLGHPDWKKAQIKLFAIYPQERVELERQRLVELVRAGRLPIAPDNVEPVLQTAEVPRVEIINRRSRDADFVILGFQSQSLDHFGSKIFEGYDRIGNVLFVNTTREIEIERRQPEELPAEAVEVPAELYETQAQAIVTDDDPPARAGRGRKSADK